MAYIDAFYNNLYLVLFNVILTSCDSTPVIVKFICMVFYIPDEYLLFYKRFSFHNNVHYESRQGNQSIVRKSLRLM